MKKLELKAVSKFFPQPAEHDLEQVFFTALDSVSLEFYSSQIHTLLGENGAGKSTLVHILCGFHTLSKGVILLNGREVFFNSPAEAIEHGIAIVHQHPLLAESVTVLENILCGVASFSLFSEEAIREFNKIKAEWSIELDYRKKVSSLSSSERFFTSLIGALYRKPSFLILDEPTSVLDTDLQIRFMEAVQKAKNNGLGIILITHKIDEAVKWSDTITVLKHGKIIFQTVEKTDSHTLSKYLNPIENSLLSRTNTTTNIDREDVCPVNGKGILFTAKNICCKPFQRQELKSISFTAAPYGITGIFGLPGSGIEVLEDILCGMIRSERGSITLTICDTPEKTQLEGSAINPYTLRKKGVSFVPSRRTIRASHPEISIKRIVTAPLIALNILDTSVKEKKSKQHVNSTTEEWVTTLLLEENLSIYPLRLGKTLSGGQLQRIVLARELASTPNICILSEPEWGLDIKSTKILRDRLRQEAKNGMTIIILTDTPDTMEGDGFYTKKYTLVQGCLHEN